MWILELKRHKQPFCFRWNNLKMCALMFACVLWVSMKNVFERSYWIGGRKTADKNRSWTEQTEQWAQIIQYLRHSNSVHTPPPQKSVETLFCFSIISMDVCSRLWEQQQAKIITWHKLFCAITQKIFWKDTWGNVSNEKNFQIAVSARVKQQNTEKQRCTKAGGAGKNPPDTQNEQNRKITFWLFEKEVAQWWSGLQILKS